MRGIIETEARVTGAVFEGVGGVSQERLVF